MLIRKLLIKLLGFNNYLALISRIFLQTFVNKWYLNEHKQVRFVKHLVKAGDICIDIGANLGYFSVPLSRYIGKNGKLYSVEPVVSFRKHLIGNLKKFGLNNAEVLPYALGEEDHKKIQMVTPEVDGVIRHGRTEVKEISSHNSVAFEHETELMRPQTLFGNLKKIDFIKCDVEGYELHIIPLFVKLIKQKKPILEIEIDSIENKSQIITLLNELAYKVYFLEEEKLRQFDITDKAHLKEIELYFIPSERVDNFKHIISSS